MNNIFHGSPDRIENAKEFLQRATPVVYGWWRNNNYLYIGMSLHGTHRVESHPIIGVLEELQADDEIHWWTVDATTIGVKEYEAKLIEMHRPKYNKDQNPDYRKHKFHSPSNTTVRAPRGSRRPKKLHQPGEGRLVNGRWVFENCD